MGDSIEKEWQNVNNLERDIKCLEQNIEALSNDNMDVEDDPELNELLVENTKLKHRLAILNKAIANERQQSLKPLDLDNLDAPISMIAYFTKIFSVAIAAAFPDLPNPPEAAVVVGSNPKFNDYQCNSSMQLAAVLKPIYAAKGEKPPSPRDIALKILANVPESPLIEKMDVSGPGFINIFLSKAYPEKILTSFLLNGVQPPKHTPKRAVVDFSSPNIAKQMHVGHLRSTIIGESICRLLEFFGHDVLRLNHVGDWGTQFGMLIAHLEDKFPNFAEVSPPISDLQAFYKESKTRFDSDEAFKKRAYNCVVKLQGGDPITVKAWTLICDVSRKEFQRIYDRLDIKLVERGESFYQSRMEKLVADLEAKGLLVEDEGRKIIWGVDNPGENDVPLTLVKSDGGFTYDTSDMATIKQRVEEEKADWIIYVVDAGQAVHFKTFFQCAERLGITKPDVHRIEHVGFGVVLGEDGKKFKTRSGDTVKLSDLLDEGLSRAMDKLKEKGRDKVLTPEELKQAQESVAYGCIKYADLSHNRINEYVFSFDRMLDDKGNTAVYLLYAFARIKSIARNCGGDYANNIKEVARKNPIKIEHEKELKLAKVLVKFPDVIERVLKDLSLHYLCEFVYDVCTTFTEFYDVCYCIEKTKTGEIVKINTSRVLLAECTAQLLAKCFHILGLKAVPKI